MSARRRYDPDEPCLKVRVLYTPKTPMYPEDTKDPPDTVAPGHQQDTKEQEDTKDPHDTKEPDDAKESKDLSQTEDQSKAMFMDVVQDDDWRIVHFPRSMLPFSEVLQGFAESIDGDDEIIDIPESVRIRPEAFDFVYPFLFRRIVEPEAVEQMDKVTLDPKTTSAHEYDVAYLDTLLLSDKFRFAIACDYLNIECGKTLFAKYIGRLVSTLPPADIAKTFDTHGCDL